MNLRDYLALKRPEYRPKSDRWCKQCSRKHNPKDVCKMYLRTRKLKSGRIVQRWSTK